MAEQRYILFGSKGYLARPGGRVPENRNKPRVAARYHHIRLSVAVHIADGDTDRSIARRVICSCSKTDVGTAACIAQYGDRSSGTVVEIRYCQVGSSIAVQVSKSNPGGAAA